ncbi:unnamed protein product [Choristocarpus tenellus]
MSAISGFLFGYDTGVVSGAMLLLRDEFELSGFQQEVVVSITMVASIIGCLMAGRADRFCGRWSIIFFSSIVFTVGALMLAAAQSYRVLVVGRFVVGLAIGLASMTSPVYIAEIAPAHERGMLTLLNTLFISGGQFVAGMVDGAFSNVLHGWRWMLGLGAVPSLLLMAGCILLPESPRWLMKEGREEDAEHVLRTIRESDEEIQQEMEDMRKSVEENSGHARLSDLYSTPGVRKAMILGCGLMVLNQFTGINTIMYYAASVLSMAGFNNSTAIWLAGFAALAQATGVTGGLFLVERYGRRPLLLTSLVLVTLSLWVIGLSFFLLQGDSATVMDSDLISSDLSCSSFSNVFLGPVVVESCSSCVDLDGCGFCQLPGLETGVCLQGSVSSDSGGVCPDGSDWKFFQCEGNFGWLAVLAMVAYLLFFGIGMSGIPWTMNAELYPLHIRSLATSVATAVNWISNVFVSATFLSITSPTVFTKQGAFWLYAIVGMVGWAWLYVVMPETAGLSLEEIKQLFVPTEQEVENCNEGHVESPVPRKFVQYMKVAQEEVGRRSSPVGVS